MLDDAADGIDAAIDQLVEDDRADPDPAPPAVQAAHVPPAPNPADGAVRFSAGTCFSCGGTGRAYYPSSGTVTVCGNCQGSGVG